MAKSWRKSFRAGAAAAAALLAWLAADASADQTIVFMRHGEKPAQGLGQLTCQGLNRALALPQLLQTRFGTPTAIYAPDPGFVSKDKGIEYSYVRPLATIEPTAIRFGLPVHAGFGFRQIDLLQQDLLQPAYSSATVYVAWEHYFAQQAALHIVNAVGGDAQQVPPWADDDFDSLYVLRLKWQDGKPVAIRFERESEGLDHQSADCPNPRP
jgi:hypothetical protein